MDISADISQLLSQMRAMAARVEGGPGALDGAGEVRTQGFSELLRNSLEAVNTTQQQARELAERFQAGEPGADLARVMVAMEKASVSFEAVTQVRNRLVEAYQEIMRMQV